MKVALNRPLEPNLKTLNFYLEEINKRGWYTNFGPLQQQLKDRLEEYLGVKNLLLVNNGTSALQISALTFDLKKVICPSFSFLATASAYTSLGRKLVFNDINTKDLNISTESIENNLLIDNEVDSILGVHVYGNPCDVESISGIANKHHKKVIYDAAQAFGINYHGESVLNWGDASILSFHATKIFHTIEGGGIVFKSEDSYKLAKSIINFGIDGNLDDMDKGINAKMNEYQAAVGLVNLNVMDNVIEHRSELYSAYESLLKDSVGLIAWNSKSNSIGSYFPIILDSQEKLNGLKLHLISYGIESRQYFYPNLNDVYSGDSYTVQKNSSSLKGRVLCLPLHFYMLLSDVKYITNVVKAFL